MFLTVFDERYARWGLLLLRCLARHHPEVPAHVIGVDLSSETVGHCHDVHANLMVHHRQVDDQSSLRGTLIANGRPRWTAEVISIHDPPWVLLMDADLLVRASLTKIMDTRFNFDLALVIRPGLHHGVVRRRLRAAAGLVMIAQSGFSFLEEWSRLMARTQAIEDVQPGAWFWEQICLFDAFASSSLLIGRINRDEFLSSPPFNSHAAIWSANVKPIDKDKIFDLFAEQVEIYDV